MRLTIVGCAPAYTLRSGRASSCYLVESEQAAVLLDLGQGSFAALGAYLDPRRLTAVFVSHLHPDHNADLVSLRHYLRYACHPPGEVALHAPAELRARYDALLGEKHFLAALPGEDLAPGTLEVEDLVVHAVPVTHALNSYAFRVSLAGGGRPGLVYSGDCGRAEDLLPMVQDGDTLLCEASWGASPVPPEGEALHLTALDAASVARKRRAARLLLTHVLDEYDPPAALARAREAFPGPVALAEPGMAFDVG